MKQSICAVCLFVTLQFSYGQTRPLIVKKIDLKEQEELNKLPVIKPVAINALNQQQTDRVSLFNAYLLKALLHRYDPKEYPITQDPSSIDQMALKIVNAISEKRFTINKNNISKLTSITDPVRLQMLGKFRDINFRLPVLANNEIIRALNPAVADLRVLFNAKKLIQVNQQQVPPDFTAADFILRAVHCVDETDPEGFGTDDMILAGVLYELNTDLVSANAYYCGEFNDDDYSQYGEYLFGTVPFASNNYPKYYYCMLGLIEQDNVESGDELAHDIRNALSQIGGKVCEIPGQGCTFVAGEMASILKNVINTIGFFDDDMFPIYGVSVTVNSKDEFGAELQTGKLATSPISAHGGKYKIGFRWRLRR